MADKLSPQPRRTERGRCGAEEESAVMRSPSLTATTTPHTSKLLGPVSIKTAAHRDTALIHNKTQLLATAWKFCCQRCDEANISLDKCDFELSFLEHVLLCILTIVCTVTELPKVYVITLMIAIFHLVEALVSCMPSPWGT